MRHVEINRLESEVRGTRDRFYSSRVLTDFSFFNTGPEGKLMGAEAKRV